MSDHVRTQCEFSGKNALGLALLSLQTRGVVGDIKVES